LLDFGILGWPPPSPDFIISGKNKIIGCGFRFFEMKIETLFGLKSGGNWLFYLFGKFWCFITIFYLNVKVNIRMKRNWFSSNRSWSISSAPYVMRWT